MNPNALQFLAFHAFSRVCSFTKVRNIPKTLCCKSALPRSFIRVRARPRVFYHLDKAFYG